MAQIFDLQLLFTVAACLIAAIALAVALRAPAASGRARPAPDRPPRAVLLFHGDDLVDRSPPAPDGDDDGPEPADWAALRLRLSGAFPGLPERPQALANGERLSLRSPVGTVEIERLGEVTRVVLPPSALRRENATGPRANDAGLGIAPYPVWRCDNRGTVTWHNASYATLVHETCGRDADLAQPIFPAIDQPGRKVRLSLEPRSGRSRRTLWFDVTAVPHDDETLFFATDANAVVEAEAAQRDFVQTLAKTFAQLSIGLAIFDRNRQLKLFNPALIDLTALPADFLSARPTLFDFFDRLRDCRMMPEPRNYRNWRQQMAELDAAASDGSYQETWTLPSGSVYSVSGRPHPDGAVAFLFENITAEVTLTRRFRADLEMDQAVLDQIEDAIAVFSAEGILTITNRAFRTLWGFDPDSSLRQMTVQDAARAWQDRTLPTPAWGELRDFVVQRDNRVDWSAEIRMRDGRALNCSVQPIQDGATMIRFRRTAPAEAEPLHSVAAASPG